MKNNYTNIRFSLMESKLFKKAMLLLLISILMFINKVEAQDVLGCTDTTALNYNPLATINNGTCIYTGDSVLGCTDPVALNYNPLATINNGTCIYAGDSVLGCTDPVALNYNPLATINNGTCIYAGDSVLGCTDPVALNYNPLATINNGTCVYDSIPPVYGCTDTAAINFNPLATVNNGNCIYQNYIGGCTDSSAINFNPAANLNDGSCIYDSIIWGCTDSSAINYNPNANKNDGYCEYKTFIFGCTDATAINYNPNANVDNGSCKFDTSMTIGCTNSYALNYNPYANVDNGSCVYVTVNDSIGGCTDYTALNFDPVASIDDGSCLYTGTNIPGCMSPAALNYNVNATIEDSSCVYALPINKIIPKAPVGIIITDTIGSPAQEHCAFDFSIMVDSATVKSITKLSKDTISVEWEIWQQGTNTLIVAKYAIGASGNVMIYLSLICTQSPKLMRIEPIKATIFTQSGKLVGAEPIKALTVAAYVKIDVATNIVDQVSQVFDIALYPMPVMDKLNILFIANSVEELNVSVLSIDGHCLYNKTVTSQKGQNIIEVNTSKLSDGFYILKINNSFKNIFTGKVIKIIN